MTSAEQQLNNVIRSLDRVKLETKQMIFDIGESMSELEIIQSFNQRAFDLFNILTDLTKKLNKENDYKVVSYKTLFENAIKINVKLPLDKFTLIILEYAPEIYAENEDCFMTMSVPDTTVHVGNEFSIIRSEMFKKIWTELNQNDKNIVKDNIILLTTFAHAHLYKIAIINKIATINKKHQEMLNCLP